MLQIAKEAKKEGLYTSINSNGSMQKAPLLALLPYIDAVNFDLKGFKQSFYKNTLMETFLKFFKTLFL
jgi:pyruvate formate lyase activating enzyme